MAIRIKSRHNESVAQMLRRFKKLCEKEGLTKDIKRRQYYEKPSERARRDARRSFSRNTMGPMRNDRTEGGSSGGGGGGGRMSRGPVGRSGSGPKGARAGRGGAKGGRSGPGGRGPGGRSGGSRGPGTGRGPSGPRRPSF